MTKKVVWTFGRFNPPTIGHLHLFDLVSQMGYDHFVFLSHSHDSKKNPLIDTDKLDFLQNLCPNVNFVLDPNIRTVLDAAYWLINQGYQTSVFCAGDDRLENFEKLLKSNNQKIGFKSLQFVSSGERNDRAVDLTGVSASKARLQAGQNNYGGFCQATGLESSKLVKTMFDKVRDGMLAEAAVDDAVQFHNELNPLIWDNLVLKPNVQSQLIHIAKEFIKFIDLPKLAVVDITLTGSNAAYNYTQYSDLDLHVIVSVPNDQELYRKYFDAKKSLFNLQHDISIFDIPVETYVQFQDQVHTASGVFSLMKNDWIEEPNIEQPSINAQSVEMKVNQYKELIELALESDDAELADKIWDKIKRLRKSGLEKKGEYSVENLAFKVLRNQKLISKLLEFRTSKIDQELSLDQ